MRHPLTLALLLLEFCGLAFGQGTISTIAGGSGFLDNIPAIQARLDGPQAVAIDPKGNAYIGDGLRVRRIDSQTGIITTVAGNGNRGHGPDGPATQTGLDGPVDFAFNPAGNLLFLDGNCVMRLDLQAGTLTTVDGVYGSTTPQLGLMSGLASDGAGNIFVTDSYYDKIYRIDGLTRAVTVVAGTGQATDPTVRSGDGSPATQASLGRPAAITLDSAGNIFFAEQYWLRRIDGQTGIITTIAPVSEYGSTGDGGPVSQSAFFSISSLATDSAGNLYVTDYAFITLGTRIRKIDWSTGIVLTVAGSGNPKYMADGVPALQANFGTPLSIVIDVAGSLWIGDQGNRRQFMLPATTGLLQTVAGTSANGDGGLALGALLPNPTGIAVNSQGDIFIAADAIRRVDHSTGLISTVAQGTGSVALDPAGDIFVSASSYSGALVERVDAATGAVSIVAGGNSLGFSGDGGPATKAQFSVAGLAVDNNGDLFIADSQNQRVRRIDAQTGIITTIAGNGQGPVYSGATGLATQVSIGVPGALAVTPNGDVYVSVTGFVLKIDGNGQLTTVSGTGGCLYAGDGGPANLAALCGPNGLALDPDGNLFLSDYSCGCVRRIAADTGLIQTVAGNGTRGTSADSIPATTAALTPAGVTFGGSTLYVLDNAAFASSARVRTVIPPVPPALPQPPKITQFTNAIDYRYTFAPGSLASVMGNYLASPSPASAQTGPDGLITTSLNGDQVTFSGIPAPLLYVSAGQINTVVPFSAPLFDATLQVNSGAGTDTMDNIPITPTALALINGLVLNPDGTPNGVNNPAPKGATLTLFGTGMGQTNPPGIDGVILQAPNLPVPLAQFSATVTTGIAPAAPATIAYLGPLPNAVAGAMQVNVQVPGTTPAGKSSLSIGPVAAPQDIYMLSDPPVLTGTSPASPIQQSLGSGTYLSLIGMNLNAVAAVNFYQNGQPAQLQQQYFGSSTSTSYTVFVSFAGQSGDFGVQVVNAAGQVSNQLIFTVLPVPGPTVTGVTNNSGGPVYENSSIIYIDGQNFQYPLSVNIYYNSNLIANVAPFGSGNPNQFDIVYFFNSAGAYAFQVVEPGNVQTPLFPFTVYPPGTVVITALASSPLNLATGAQTVGLIGGNFEEGLTAALYSNGQKIATLTGSQVFVPDDYYLTLSINFNGQAGTYGVQLTNPDGGQSNLFMFEAVAPPNP